MVDPQNRGDHVDGDRHAEGGHQVERRPRDDAPQGLVDDPLHLRPELGHPGVQRLGQGLADARVVGVVQQQDAGGLAAIVRVGVGLHQAPRQKRLAVGPDRVAPQGAVRHQAAHVGVAGQDHAARGLVAMHRATGAQVVQQDMRVCAIGGIERRQLEHRRKGLVGHLVLHRSTGG